MNCKREGCGFDSYWVNLLLFVNTLISSFRLQDKARLWVSPSHNVLKIHLIEGEGVSEQQVSCAYIATCGVRREDKIERICKYNKHKIDKTTKEINN